LQNQEYITRKFRIYPDKQQTTLFNKCANITRYFYNKANEYVINLNKDKTKDKTKDKPKFNLPSVKIIRKNILTSDSNLTEKEKWQKEVPYDTRELAIRRLHKSYATAFSLLKNNKIKKFQVKPSYTSGFKIKFQKRKII